MFGSSIEKHSALKLLLGQLFVTMVCWASAASVQAQEAPLRLAMVGFNHSPGRESAATSDRIEGAVKTLIGQDSRVVLVDETIVRPALAGVRFDGSINMTRDDARRAGAAIGCDFFITGKLEIVTRSEKKAESHEESFAGVMIVNARSGELALFDFLSEKAASREIAVNALEQAIRQRFAGYVDQVLAIRAHRQSIVPLPPATARTTVVTIVEDLPDQDSPRSVGFKPPQFISRVKPGYTTEAEQADITATVEMMAIFQSDGNVGAIEITRWGGFGLDESAAAAVRQFKFSPASRDGKPISVRAMIRYNFRRVNDTADQIEAPTPQPPENRRETSSHCSSQRTAGRSSV